jgi:hypothetical protein
MVAWKDAVLVNTAAAYRAFLAQYPDSDLTATARKLIERLRYRPDAMAAIGVGVANVALAGPTCPCNIAPAQPKKADAATKKRADRDPPPRTKKRRYVDDDDVVVVRDVSPPIVYGPPVGVGIGIGGGYGYGRFGGGGFGRGRY